MQFVWFIDGELGWWVVGKKKKVNAEKQHGWVKKVFVFFDPSYPNPVFEESRRADCELQEAQKATARTTAGTTAPSPHSRNHSPEPQSEPQSEPQPEPQPQGEPTAKDVTDLPN